MAFAIFYDDSDLLAMAVQLARCDLPTGLAATAALMWDGGFSDWRVAPACPYDFIHGDIYPRIVVIQAVGGLQAFHDLLAAIGAAFPGDEPASYMIAIASDLDGGGTLGNNDAAVEPWP